jgi:hypothetical protein
MGASFLSSVLMSRVLEEEVISMARGSSEISASLTGICHLLVEGSNSASYGV